MQALHRKPTRKQDIRANPGRAEDVLKNAEVQEEHRQWVKTESVALSALRHFSSALSCASAMNTRSGEASCCSLALQ